MWKVYKLGEIYAALRDATDEEVPRIRDGMRVVTTNVLSTPLMEIEYALDDHARDVVSRYTNIY